LTIDLAGRPYRIRTCGTLIKRYKRRVLGHERSNSSYLFIGDLASDDDIMWANILEKLDYYYKGGQKCGMLRNVTCAATAW
jgi:hypothetical protein